MTYLQKLSFRKRRSNSVLTECSDRFWQTRSGRLCQNHYSERQTKEAPCLFLSSPECTFRHNSEAPGIFLYYDPTFSVLLYSIQIRFSTANDQNPSRRKDLKLEAIHRLDRCLCFVVLLRNLKLLEGSHFTRLKMYLKRGQIKIHTCRQFNGQLFSQVSFSI